MGTKLTVSQVILNLYKTAFGELFRLYRVGDPITPGQSELPAIFVTETATEFNQDATGYDKIVHHVLTQIVFNKKDEMGRPVEDNTLDTVIDNIIYGRDDTTNEYLEASLMGVLRKNYTLGGLSIDTISDARKGVVPRPEDMLTIEGQVEITVSELQPVNNRS